LVAALAVVGALAVGFFALIGAAGAEKKDSSNNRMHSYFEVPSISSPTAQGRIEVRIQNTDPATIDYTLTFSGLSANAAQAHIHFAQRDVNGGVVAFLCGGGDKPPCGTTSGTISGTIDSADVLPQQGIGAGEMAEFVAAIRAGVTYANVHTGNFPGGEIRGQIRARGGGGDD
jgi:hypothetical protein